MAHREFEEEAMGVVKVTRQSAQLEIPVTGHSAGRVPHYALIGRKLERLYDVPDEQSDAIEALLRDLEKKIGN